MRFSAMADFRALRGASAVMCLITLWCQLEDMFQLIVMPQGIEKVTIQLIDTPTKVYAIGARGHSISTYAKNRPSMTPSPLCTHFHTQRPDPLPFSTYARPDPPSIKNALKFICTTLNQKQWFWSGGNS